MREAIAALDLVVVIDVAFTETARLADYVLPVASQFEKAEATFFNFEFPHNYFHLRKAAAAAAARALLRGGAPRAPAGGARRHARGSGGVAALPPGARAARRSARSSSSWPARTRSSSAWRRRCSIARSATCCPRASPRRPASGPSARSPPSATARSLARAGFTGEPGEAGDALFDALLTSKSAVVFAIDRLAGELRAAGHAEPPDPAGGGRALRGARRPGGRSRGRARAPTSRSCCRRASAARSPPTPSSATPRGGRRTARAPCA